MPNEIYVNYEEIQSANDDSAFGNFVELDIKNKQLATGGIDKTQGEVVFRLFGIIPIKKIDVKVLPEEEVYVGGTAIGLNITTEGAVVVSNAVIENESAKVLKNKYIENGDIIQRVNDFEVKNVADLTSALEKVNDSYVNLSILRGNEHKEVTIPLLKDKDNSFRLGVWVKDDYSGIGTLSFVLSESNKFGALGHAITNGKDEYIVPMSEGEIYSCSLVSVEKGENNKPGQLQCVFVERDKKGEIAKNTKVGIFGHLDNLDGLVDTNKTAKLGGRLSVKMGKAKLISTVSGLSQEYDIEIVKVNNQSRSSDKSFVFRVVDKELLEITGGIVQGMSGSPIMQNGKVVGAVTHVFVADSTMGYGVYTDWMLENLE